MLLGSVRRCLLAVRSPSRCPTTRRWSTFADPRHLERMQREACASGGRALASKALIERLEAHDSAALEVDPTHTSYTMLADLATTTEKARRDAPAIAVCDLVE